MRPPIEVFSQDLQLVAPDNLSRGPIQSGMGGNKQTHITPHDVPCDGEGNKAEYNVKNAL